MMGLGLTMQRMGGWAGLVWVTVAAAGQTPVGVPVPDPVTAAAENWMGRALILRGAYGGGELEFDRAGHVKGSPKVTDWTLAGMDLEKITRRTDGVMELDGTRVAINYNQAAHVFERRPQKEERLRVLLAAPANAGELDAEMAAVFSQGMDPAFERAQPTYWSHYFLPATEWPADGLAGQTILGLNGKLPADVVLPVAEKKPEPEMSAEARAARIKGTMQASFVVGTDGVPRRIVIRQPLGWGLDARVAETLTRWRFKPGMENGKPVPVEVIFNQGFDFVAPPVR